MRFKFGFILVTIQVLGYGSSIAEESLLLPPSTTILPKTTFHPPPPPPTSTISPPTKSPPLEVPQKWLNGAIDQMNVEVLYILEKINDAEGNNSENNLNGFVTSQLSTMLPLVELSLFVKDQSKKQLDGWLRIPKYVDIKRVLPSFINDLRSSKYNVELHFLSQMFINKKRVLTKTFEDVINNNFGTDHAYVEFVYPEAAARTINEFIYRTAEHKVSHVIVGPQIGQGSLILIANALYFKSEWKTAFNKSLTSSSVFWRDTGSYKLMPFMKKTDKMLYANSPELHAEILTMPFANEVFDFVIINPLDTERVGAIKTVFNTLIGNPRILDVAEQQQEMTLVELTMPKIEISSELNMKEILNQLGVTNLFDKRTANLHGLFVGDPNSCVTEMHQQIMINIDEKGATAAAGDGILEDSGLLRSSEAKEVVNIDRPFIFMIRFRRVPLFMGTFNGLG